MALCETPSRIWRRIQDEQEPSSLPSLPEFEHSLAPETVSDQTSSADENNEIQPVHSTPVAVTATAKLQSSTSSTLRFASSIASRSASAKLSASRTYTRNPQESFDISAITSLPGRSYEDNAGSDEAHLSKSTNSVPEAYLPPMETDEGEDMSLVDALESVSRASSPLPPDFPIEAPTPKKGLKYDYSISLRSEPKVRLCVWDWVCHYKPSFSPPPLTSIAMLHCASQSLAHEPRPFHEPRLHQYPLHQTPLPRVTARSIFPGIRHHRLQKFIYRYRGRHLRHPQLRPSRASLSHPKKKLRLQASRNRSHLQTDMDTTKRVSQRMHSKRMKLATSNGNPLFLRPLTWDILQTQSPRLHNPRLCNLLILPLSRRSPRHL